MIDFLKKNIDLGPIKTGDELVEMWRKRGFLSNIPTCEGEMACARTLDNVAREMVKHPEDYSRWQYVIFPVMVRLYNGCTGIGYTEEPLHYTKPINVNSFLCFVRSTTLNEWFSDVVALNSDFRCIHLVIASWFKSLCHVVSFDTSKTFDEFAEWLEKKENKERVKQYQTDHILSYPDLLAEFCAVVSRLFGIHLTQKEASKTKRGYETLCKNTSWIPPTTPEEAVNFWHNTGFLAGVNEQQETYLIETFDSVCRDIEQPDSMVDEAWDSFILPFLRQLIVRNGINRPVLSDEFFDLVNHVTVKELLEVATKAINDIRVAELGPGEYIIDLRDEAVSLINKVHDADKLTITQLIKTLVEMSKSDPTLGYFISIDWEADFDTSFAWLLATYMRHKEAPAE